MKIFELFLLLIENKICETEKNVKRGSRTSGDWRERTRAAAEGENKTGYRREINATTKETKGAGEG